MHENQSLVYVPTLDQLACDSSLAFGLPPAVLFALHVQAIAAISAIGFGLGSAGPTSQPIPIEKSEDRMLTVDEACARLRKGRQWLYRNQARLPFVRRISRKSLLISEAGLNAFLAAKPALRHNRAHETQRPVGKSLGQTAAKPHGADENPRSEGTHLAARAYRNGTRSLPQNAPQGTA